MADLKEILQLLDDQDNGTLSEEGRQTLETFGNESPANRALIEKGLSIELLRVKVNEKISQLVTANREELWQKIELQRQHQLEIQGPDLRQQDQLPRTKSRRSLLLTFLAAAAVLLIIALFWLLRTSDKKETADITESNRPSITYNIDKVVYIDSVPEEDTVLRAGNWVITKTGKKHLVFSMAAGPAGKGSYPGVIPPPVSAKLIVTNASSMSVRMRNNPPDFIAWNEFLMTL